MAENEKEKVVIENPAKNGRAPKAEKPEDVVKTAPKTAKKGAPKAPAVIKAEGGWSIYSRLGFEELMSEVKARGLESKAKGLTDSEKGRRTLRAILREDDEEKGVKPHLGGSSEVKVKKTNRTKTAVKTAPKTALRDLPWWVWLLVLIAAALLLWGIFRPRSSSTATVDLTSLQTSIGQLSTKVDALGQSVADLAGRVTALEASAPTEEPVDTSDAVIPDTVQKFRDLGAFYIDGDQFIENWKVQGAQMKYTCEYDYGVYVSMDPGVVNGHSTGDLGAVWYISCKKGDVITMTTPHWSTSALHQQVHLVEFTQELTDDQALNFLKVLKVDEGKQIAYFINSSGEVSTY